MRDRFVALLKQLAEDGNHWYIWGAQGPTYFDCSGLVMWLGSQVGLWPKTADTTADGLWKGTFGGVRIPRSELAPGDLVLYGGTTHRATHVEVWVGPGTATIGANGGRSSTTTPERARAINAKVKQSNWTRRRDLLGFVRLPFPDAGRTGPRCGGYDPRKEKWYTIASRMEGDRMWVQLRDLERLGVIEIDTNDWPLVRVVGRRMPGLHLLDE